MTFALTFTVGLGVGVGIGFGLGDGGGGKVVGSVPAMCARMRPTKSLTDSASGVAGRVGTAESARKGMGVGGRGCMG